MIQNVLFFEGHSFTCPLGGGGVGECLVSHIALKEMGGDLDNIIIV